jgi:hypothetical protein
MRSSVEELTALMKDLESDRVESSPTAKWPS